MGGDGLDFEWPMMAASLYRSIDQSLGGLLTSTDSVASMNESYPNSVKTKFNYMISVLLPRRHHLNFITMSSYQSEIV